MTVWQRVSPKVDRKPHFMLCGCCTLFVLVTFSPTHPNRCNDDDIKFPSFYFIRKQLRIFSGTTCLAIYKFAESRWISALRLPIKFDDQRNAELAETKITENKRDRMSSKWLFHDFGLCFDNWQQSGFCSTPAWNNKHKIVGVWPHGDFWPPDSGKKQREKC